MNQPLPEKADSTILAQTHPVKYSWAKTDNSSNYQWTTVTEEDEIAEEVQIILAQERSINESLPEIHSQVLASEPVPESHPQALSSEPLSESHPQVLSSEPLPESHSQVLSSEPLPESHPHESHSHCPMSLCQKATLTKCWASEPLSSSVVQWALVSAMSQAMNSPVLPESHPQESHPQVSSFACARIVESAFSGRGWFIRPCLRLVFPTAAEPRNIIRPYEFRTLPLCRAWWYFCRTNVKSRKYSSLTTPFLFYYFLSCIIDKMMIHQISDNCNEYFILNLHLCLRWRRYSI